MNGHCGIYWRDASDGSLALVCNKELLTAQAFVDKCNACYTDKPGRYVIGPWIDFANGPVTLPEGLDR